MADSAAPLDTGYRWRTVTPDDRSGILYIITFLTFTYSSITFITRCFIKWHVLGHDDAAMAVAQTASIIQFALLLVSLSAGLGKTYDLLDADQYAQMASSQFGNQVALYATLGFSKIATILLTQRLFTRDMKKAWIICNIVTGCVVAWTIMACFLVSVGCSPASTAPKQYLETCPHIETRYLVIVITDAITDVILVIIPAYLCWQLQMSVLVKLQVLAVFSFRLPLVVLTALVFKTWTRSLSESNPGVYRTPAIVFQQMELCVSLIAGTIPCLKSFIRSFDTGSGVKAGYGSSNEYGSYGRSSSNALQHNESYKLSSMSRSKSGTPHTRSRAEDDGEIRVNPRPFAHSNSRYNLQEREPDRDSQGSRQELFIRKDLVWEIGSDARRGSDTPGMLRLPK